jgi:hypothetical protein
MDSILSSETGLDFSGENRYDNTMGNVTIELISLFSFLLPGFITSFLFYSLTSFPKKSEFEAVVIALIYTIIINAVVEILAHIFTATGYLISFGEWNTLSKTIWAIIVALIMGLSWSFFYNNDTLHKLLRKLRITKQSSYPSEWYGVFSENKKYVILHLKDKRRILGWPMEWPNNPKKGHFVLEAAEWLIDNDGKNEAIPLTGVDKIVIDTINIEMVEFLNDNEELSGGKQDGA